MFAGLTLLLDFCPGFSFPAPAADVYTHITNRSPAPHFNEPSGFVEENMRGRAVGKYIEMVRNRDGEARAAHFIAVLM